MVSQGILTKLVLVKMANKNLWICLDPVVCNARTLDEIVALLKGTLLYWIVQKVSSMFLWMKLQNSLQQCLLTPMEIYF